LVRAIGLIEDSVSQPLPEARIVAELLEEFRVIRQKFDQDPLERPIVLYAGVLLVEFWTAFW